MKLFLCLLFIISFLFINFIFTIYGRQTSRFIENIKNVVVPSIINEQYYYFNDVNYLNISFKQLSRSNDLLSDSIKKFGSWSECKDIYDIYKSGKKEGVFVDLGANVGSCSYIFALAKTKVFAFEPLPNNLFQFSLTTFMNSNFSKYITIYPYALGNENKKQAMSITKKNWGYSSFYYKHSDYSETVEVRKLDEFKKIIPTKVSMIKIDVEGSEVDLLEGGKEFFKTHKAEFIHMEVSCYNLLKVSTILYNMGYKIIKAFDCKRINKSNIVAKFN